MIALMVSGHHPKSLITFKIRRVGDFVCLFVCSFVAQQIMQLLLSAPDWLSFLGPCVTFHRVASKYLPHSGVVKVTGINVKCNFL